MPPPRPRVRAGGRGAGRPPSVPRQRSPRKPAAAPSGRKRLRSNRFQLLQTKPPDHPARRGRRAGGAGPYVTPGSGPANRRPRVGGGPARSWKGLASAAESCRAFPGSPRSTFPAHLEPQRVAGEIWLGVRGAYCGPQSRLRRGVEAGASVLNCIISHSKTRESNRPNVLCKLS